MRVTRLVTESDSITDASQLAGVANGANYVGSKLKGYLGGASEH